MSEEENGLIVNCQIRKETEFYRIIKKIASIVEKIVMIFKTQKQIHIFGFSVNKTLIYEVYLEMDSFEFYNNIADYDVPIVISTNKLRRILLCNILNSAITLKIIKDDKNNYLKLNYNNPSINGEFDIDLIDETSEELGNERNFLENNEIKIHSKIFVNAINKFQKIADVVQFEITENAINLSCKNELTNTSIEFKENITETIENKVEIKNNNSLILDFDLNILLNIVNDITNNLIFLTFDNGIMKIRYEQENIVRTICFLKSRVFEEDDVKVFIPEVMDIPYHTPLRSAPKKWLLNNIKATPFQNTDIKLKHLEEVSKDNKKIEEIWPNN